MSIVVFSLVTDVTKPSADTDLRKTTLSTLQYCFSRKTGLPYLVLSYSHAFKDTLQRLNDLCNLLYRYL